MQARQGERLLGRWQRRAAHLRRRIRMDAGDLRRALSWEVGGGRAHFLEQWRAEAAAHCWIFILGCNNSGTSLLHRLLERTGQVSTFPYEGQLYTRALARDDDRRYARIWTEYADALRLEPGDSLACAPRLVHDWMTSLPRPLRPFIVEKTPVNTARARWLQQVFPSACFIGMVRNGYAVAEGIRRKARQPLAAGARHWSAANRMLLEQASGLSAYLEVRYEDLAERPAETLERVCRWAGIADASAASVDLHAIRNRNGESLARLSRDERAVVTAHAGEMLERFGYLEQGE